MRTLLVIATLISTQVFSQSVKFVSDVDAKLTTKKIAIVPFVDNVSDIYAKPMSIALKNEFEKSQQMTVEIIQLPNGKKTKFSPEEIENKPDAVIQILKRASVNQTESFDSLAVGRISKGPNGITIHLALFSGADGMPIAMESINDIQNFELSELKNQLPKLVHAVVSKLPYHGILLSRKNQSVTLNIGSASGLSAGDELTAIQIIKVNRHPKFNFIVGTENLTLGIIRIDKVDEYISFGTITSEREANVINPGMKLSASKFIKYLDTKTDVIAFGDKAKEWMPSTAPSYGKIGVLLGFAQYEISNNISATGGAAASNLFVPNIHTDGEIWFSPTWYMNMDLSSYAFSVTNPLSGSTPSNLNVSTSRFALSGGYNFLIDDDFFGPKIQTSLGYATTSSFIDGSSPTAFESMTFGGLNLGVAGFFPVPLPHREFPLVIGAQLNYFFFNPTAKESPTSSGSNVNPQISRYLGFLETRINQRLNLRAELMFDMLSANFSGTASRSNPASSASHKITTMALGIEYWF